MVCSTSKGEIEGIRIKVVGGRYEEDAEADTSILQPDFVSEHEWTFGKKYLSPSREEIERELAIMIQNMLQDAERCLMDGCGEEDREEGKKEC